MFVPCIIRLSRNGQQYALICTTPLFYILAPTCFGSSLPSSESFLDPSELLAIQIEMVVYHIMCSYVTCVPDYRGSTEPRKSGTSTTHKLINKPKRHKHPLFKIVNDALVDLPAPPTITGWWSFESLLGICLVAQIVTELFLAINKINDSDRRCVHIPDHENNLQNIYHPFDLYFK
jgi:hypothetical protein